MYKRQGRRRAEHRPHVGGVHDVFQHRHPPGVLADVPGLAGSGAPHGTKHTPGEGIAGEGGQHLPVTGVHRHIRAAGQHRGGRAVHLAALHEERQRLAARVQGTADDLGAFGNEQAVFPLGAAAQLGFGQAGKGRQFRGVEVVYLDAVSYTHLDVYKRQVYRLQPLKTKEEAP